MTARPNFMKHLYRLIFWGVLPVTISAGAQNRWNTAHVIPPKTEAQLVQQLDPTNSADAITDAIGLLEDLHGVDASHTNSIAALKKLLADTREPVRRKAARVLGVFHAPMDETDIRLVCAQLRASDWREVQSGLKALRDLHASAAVPDVLPCLKHPNPFVVRDACRTLAVIATKDVIPALEPLVKSPDEAVRKDAQNAINQLNAGLKQESN